MYGDEYVELENKQIKTEQTAKSEKPTAPSIVKKKLILKFLDLMQLQKQEE